jgi:hypothetical protein
MSAGFENATTKSVEVNAAPSRFPRLFSQFRGFEKALLCFTLQGPR